MKPEILYFGCALYLSGKPTIKSEIQKKKNKKNPANPSHFTRTKELLTVCMSYTLARLYKKFTHELKLINKCISSTGPDSIHVAKTKKYHSEINPFSINVPLLYPLITSENRRFPDVFRGYRSGTLVENGLQVPYEEYTCNVLGKGIG